jgi:hypothetical protein
MPTTPATARMPATVRMQATTVKQATAGMQETAGMKATTGPPTQYGRHQKQSPTPRLTDAGSRFFMYID